jgi:hypothetical protein
MSEVPVSFPMMGCLMTTLPDQQKFSTQSIFLSPVLIDALESLFCLTDAPFGCLSFYAVSCSLNALDRPKDDGLAIVWLLPVLYFSLAGSDVSCTVDYNTRIDSWPC